MGKILNFQDLNQEIKDIKSKGKLVVVGGCFDILHDGHIKFLDEAKKLGDTLLVILESDDSVSRRKGKNRPVNNVQIRAKSLAELSSVDYVLNIPDFNRDRDYYNLVKTIQPDIIAVTINDPLLVKKRNQAQLVGGKVVEVIERIPNLSTTNLIK